MADVWTQVESTSLAIWPEAAPVAGWHQVGAVFDLAVPALIAPIPSADWLQVGGVFSLTVPISAVSPPVADWYQVFEYSLTVAYPVIKPPVEETNILVPVLLGAGVVVAGVVLAKSGKLKK